MGSVVVGVNASPGSLSALRAAAVEARRRRRPLDVVLAWEAMGVAFGRRAAVPRALLRVHQEGAEQMLDETLEVGLTAHGDLDLRRHAIRGDPARVLPAFAAREGEILVVGSGLTGRSPVARACVRASTCPVLVVPPGPLLREHPRLARRAAGNVWNPRAPQR